jgi:hypothetical protein
MEGGPEVVVNELRGWLDDMLHRLLPASMVWACLVRETVSPDDFLLTTRPMWPPRGNRAAAHRRGARPHWSCTQPCVVDLVARLSDPGLRQVMVVLYGRAGSGKSAHGRRRLTDPHDGGLVRGCCPGGRG